MPIIKKHIKITFLTILLLICSCAKFITIEFIEKKSSESVFVNGWKLKPDLYSVRGIAGKMTQEQLNRFVLFMDAIKIKERDKTNIVDINFENISVILKPSNEIIPISLRYICCVSYSSLKYIEKAYEYDCDNQERLCPITIPEKIDTIVLKFDAVFYNGVLSKEARGSVIYDHIIVNDSTSIERIPVEIEMYRKVSSSIGINFGD